MSTRKKSGKRSTVRHTRAIQRDRSKTPLVGPAPEQVEELLTQVVHPATFDQLGAYRAMGLRQRTLTLPVTVAFVLSLLWRQVGAVSEAVRALRREGLLWAAPVSVSQQAVSERLRTFPAELFERVFEAVLPRMKERALIRERPLCGVVARALEHFEKVVAVDGSTLDALVKKLGLLREHAQAPLAGRMAALLNVASRLPEKVWYEEDSQAHDQRFCERVMGVLEPGWLVLFDLGFTNFAFFDQLTQQQVGFITRAKQNLRFTVMETLFENAQAKDQLVRTGCEAPMRLVQVLYKGRWYRYLTNVVDQQVLPLPVVVGLYWQRWRIEDAFHVVKRLLGLAYFYVGSINGIQVQLWGTWILYAVLIDLADAVAEKLCRPLGDISIEMVFRGLYHFTQAAHRGETTDPVAYLAAKENQDLGVLKRSRPTASDRILLVITHKLVE